MYCNLRSCTVILDFQIEQGTGSSSGAQSIYGLFGGTAYVTDSAEMRRNKMSGAKI